LLSLDRVYTFKLALSTYSRILAEVRTSSSQEHRERENAALTAAVDELRLLISTQNGRKISKSYLMRAYDHVSVSTASMVAVNRAYMSCYTGEPPITGVDAEPVDKTSIPLLVLDDKRAQNMSEGIQRLDCGPHRMGPVTPNGFEDVTPVTRGEWGFLMGDQCLGNLAAVETC